MATTQCQCESVHHFPPEDLEPHLAGLVTTGTGHRYLQAPVSPVRKAMHVGPICEECALTHMATYLLKESQQ